MIRHIYSFTRHLSNETRVISFKLCSARISRALPFISISKRRFGLIGNKSYFKRYFPHGGPTNGIFVQRRTLDNIYRDDYDGGLENKSYWKDHYYDKIV